MSQKSKRTTEQIREGLLMLVNTLTLDDVEKQAIFDAVDEIARLKSQIDEFDRDGIITDQAAIITQHADNLVKSDEYINQLKTEIARLTAEKKQIIENDGRECQHCQNLPENAAMKERQELRKENNELRAELANIARMDRCEYPHYNLADALHVAKSAIDDHLDTPSNNKDKVALAAELDDLKMKISEIPRIKKITFVDEKPEPENGDEQS